MGLSSLPTASTLIIPRRIWFNSASGKEEKARERIVVLFLSPSFKLQGKVCFQWQAVNKTEERFHFTSFHLRLNKIFARKHPGTISIAKGLADLTPFIARQPSPFPLLPSSCELPRNTRERAGRGYTVDSIFFPN